MLENVCLLSFDTNNLVESNTLSHTHPGLRGLAECLLDGLFCERQNSVTPTEAAACLTGRLRTSPCTFTFSNVISRHAPVFLGQTAHLCWGVKNAARPSLTRQRGAPTAEFMGPKIEFHRVLRREMSLCVVVNRVKMWELSELSQAAQKLARPLTARGMGGDRGAGPTTEPSHHGGGGEQDPPPHC